MGARVQPLSSSQGSFRRTAYGTVARHPYHLVPASVRQEQRRLCRTTRYRSGPRTYEDEALPLPFHLYGHTCCAYRVGSANFSQRKIGHAHDNSADSENVAGAPQPNVHAHFVFRFENGPGNQSFFLSTTKIQLKLVNHNLSRWTIDAPWTGRVREASSDP